MSTQSFQPSLGHQGCRWSWPCLHSSDGGVIAAACQTFRALPCNLIRARQSAATAWSGTVLYQLEVPQARFHGVTCITSRPEDGEFLATGTGGNEGQLVATRGNWEPATWGFSKTAGS